MKAQYWRCLNDECGFFVKRREKYPYNQKGQKWIDKARWLIAHGVIDGESWVELRCPQCGVKRMVPEPVAEEPSKGVDAEEISIVESFKGLKRANSA